MNDNIVASIAEYLEEQEARLLDPLEVCNPGFVWPDFDKMDKALLFAIEFDPAAAIAHGLLFKVNALLSYKPNPKIDTLTARIDNLYTSRYGHLYIKRRDGYVLLPSPHPVIAEDRPEHDYSGWTFDGFGDYFATNEERSKWAILLHTLIGFIPGFELPHAWSKMFDAERSRRGSGLHDYVYHPPHGKPERRKLRVGDDGYVNCYLRNPTKGNLIDERLVKHVVDHLYGNTGTLQPGIRAAIQLRTAYGDVNKVNNHTAHAIGDFLCWEDFTGFQPDHFDGDWDKLIKDGWVNMMIQALAIQPVDGFKLDKPDYWCLALS